MRNDRPRVVVAAVIALIIGVGAIVAAILLPGHSRPAGALLVFLAFFGLIVAALLIVILAQDPFRNHGADAAARLRAGRAHRLDFEVGQSERHAVSYRWDQVWGWLTVTVDGSLVVNQLVTFGFRLVRVVEFQVGVTEKHTVRIEKRRALFVSFARPQPIQAFVDGTLVAQSDDAQRDDAQSDG